MCPAELGTVALIVHGRVTEGGNMREVWQLKAFLRGHPHHLALSENPTLIRFRLFAEERLAGTYTSALGHVYSHLILLDIFIIVGPSEEGTGMPDVLIKSSGPHPTGFWGWWEYLYAFSVSVNSNYTEVSWYTSSVCAETCMNHTEAFVRVCVG